MKAITEIRSKTKSWAHQVRAYDFVYDKHGAMLAMDMGPQPLDAKVLTPWGWSSMGELLVGDLVIGGKGMATQVVETLDRGPKPVFKVTFSDGSSTECCDDHLWLVRSSAMGSQGLRPAVKSLKEIRHQLHNKEGNHKWYIPLMGLWSFETRSFDRIEPIGTKPVRCIRVGNPDGLYITDDFIVTHNTGKSKVVVDLVVNRGHGFTVIVCPLSVVDVWPNQFLLHAADPVVVLPLKKRPVAWRLKKLEKELALRKARGDDRPFVAVMNFECFRTQAMASFLKKLALKGFLELLVIDESHRIKSPGGKGSRVASKIGELVPWRLTLTGTPMPHSPLDVYAQFRFLDRNIYGWSFRRFKQRYAVMGGFRKGGRPMQVVGFRELEDLHEKFYSIAFRVKKEEVLDLPPFIHETRTCELDPESRRLYDTLEKEFVAQVKTGEVTVANALTKLLRLQQIANGFVRSDEQEVGEITETGNEKEKLLLDIVEDLPNDEPVVVFCRFHHDLDVVKRACRSVDREPLELSGRVNELEEWQRGEAPILAVQIQAGGVGVDLTRAAYCLYWSVGFSLGDYEQSLARLHRPGQKRSVTYIHLVTAGTVEEKVMKSLVKKQNVIKSVLEQIVETPF